MSLDKYYEKNWYIENFIEMKFQCENNDSWTLTMESSLISEQF